MDESDPPPLRIGEFRNPKSQFLSYPSEWHQDLVITLADVEMDR